MTETEQDLQSWWRRSCPLYEEMGLLVTQARDEVYRCEVPLSAMNSNHLQSMHAAVQMAVVEVLGGVVGMTMIPPGERANVFGAVSALQINFLRPARSALTATTRFAAAEAESVRRELAAGRNTGFSLHSELHDEAGTLVGKAQAEYVLRPRRE